jgi:hypothetical protein
MGSLTYLPGFSVKCIFQSIYADYANKSYFYEISHLNLLLWNHWTNLNRQILLGWELGDRSSLKIMSDGGRY